MFTLEDFRKFSPRENYCFNPSDLDSEIGNEKGNLASSNAARISRNLTSSFLSFSISVSLKGFLFLIFGSLLLQFSEKFILINLPAADYLLHTSIL